jgi:protein-tyrosine phosphatase
MLTKKQRVRKIFQGILSLFGVYSRYAVIDKKRVKRLVFVCSGNICRSALAEVYTREKGVSAASFGVDCPNGDPVNSDMSRVALDCGLCLQSHKTTNVKSFEFLAGDLLVAMEPKHISKIKSQIESPDRYNYALLGLFAEVKCPTIVDPYGKPDEFFKETAELICKAVDNLVENM